MTDDRSSPVTKSDLQATYNDLLALQDQTDQVPLTTALDAVGAALRSLDVAAGARDPVAWQYQLKNGRWANLPEDWRESENMPGKTYRPLYAAPHPIDLAQPAWQPIETAPKDGSVILICGSSPKYFVADVKWDGEWFLFSPEKDQYTEPCFAASHWQPLPTPPVPSTDGGGK